MAAKELEEYEADLERLSREYGEGLGEQKRLQTEAVTVLSTVVGATGEIPSLEAVVLRGSVLDDIQKTCITVFWAKRAENVKLEYTIRTLKEMIGALKAMEKRMKTEPAEIGVEEGKKGKEGGGRRK